MNFRKSRNSHANYFWWRVNRTGQAVKTIEVYKRLKNSRVLDIGCGYGSLSFNLLKKKAIVSATEIDNQKIDLTKKFLKSKKNFHLCKVSDSKLPFKNNTFDVVFLFDVLEHVGNPKKMMDECLRVLKKDGLLYIEFTPFFSLIGHHLYDYSVLPIHYFLPKEIIKKLVYKSSKKLLWSNQYHWQQFDNLNRLTINKFQEIVTDLHLLYQQRILKMPGFEVNITNWFLPVFLKEALSFSFIAIYKK